MMQRPPQGMGFSRVNPLHRSFKNPSFPANFINEHNVLDYFCNPDNIFYDMKSCNQILRMQNIDRPLSECFKEMQGDQYVLYIARPPLFVILKQRRTYEPNPIPLAYYYVINGVVYQAPDAYSLLQSRLLGAVDPLRQAFDQIMKFSRFNVAKGYSWQFATQTATDKEDEEEDEEESASNKKKSKDDEESAYSVPRSTVFQNTCTTRIMQLLFEQFPHPAGPIPPPPASSDTVPSVPPPPTVSLPPTAPHLVPPTPEQQPMDTSEPSVKRAK